MTKQTDYEARQEAKRFVRAKPWVPKDRRDILLEFARILRVEDDISEIEVCFKRYKV